MPIAFFCIFGLGVAIIIVGILGIFRSLHALKTGTDIGIGRQEFGFKVSVYRGEFIKKFARTDIGISILVILFGLFISILSFFTN